MIEIELLQLALGTRSGLSHIPSAEEWQGAFDFAEKQAVMGVMLGGVEKLDENENVRDNLPKLLLLEWIGNVEILRHESQVAVEQARRLCGEFQQAGFRTCVLKGVGNSLFYNGLQRTSGDIDLWVMPAGERSIGKGRKMTQDYVHTLYPEARGEFVHMDWPWKEEPPVEIHFTPSMDANPRVDRRLQRFFEEQAEVCFDNESSELGFAVPPGVVNGVFLLHHIKRHFLNEGIGLRHVVDYALLLRSLTEQERREVWQLLGQFNLRRFASGVMYVVKETLGFGNLPESENLGLEEWTSDKKIGEYLLSEMLEGGNFGHQDSRKGRWTGAVSRWMWFVRVALNRVRYFPTDALWSFWKRLRIGVSNMID